MSLSHEPLSPEPVSLEHSQELPLLLDSDPVSQDIKVLGPLPLSPPKVNHSLSSIFSLLVVSYPLPLSKCLCFTFRVPEPALTEEFDKGDAPLISGLAPATETVPLVFFVASGKEGHHGLASSQSLVSVVLSLLLELEPGVEKLSD
jgi:hypothetical protein